MAGGKKLIALCTSRVYDPQIHGFIVKVNEKLKNNGCSLLVFAINSDIYWEEDRPATEKYVFNLIPYDSVEAVVIMDERIKSHKIANKIISTSKKHNVPVIVADGRYEGVTCINYDYEKGFELVVRHVIEHHKVKRPHMMAGHKNNEFSDRRIDVFKKVLAENGIPFEDSMISHGDFWADPCRIATRALLKREVLPDAIICANDVMAITVSEMLQDAGYKVPVDVIVTGFDGYDGIFFTSPKITTAACNTLQLADATAEQILETISHKDACRDRKIMPVFMANESCGCPEHTEHPIILSNWFKESFARHNDDNRVLHMMTSAMQTSQNLKELSTNLRSYKTDSVLCVVDKKCFDNDINYFTEQQVENATKEFVLLYDSENPEKVPENITFDDLSEDIAEDILEPAIHDRMLELTEREYPLIFNALDYMNRPFGFVCYHFSDYLISNYSNAMGVTNAISIGIGGYINIQYQSMLLEKMDEMYRHDPLTGLYNRIGFMNIFNGLKKKPENRNKPITVLMSDLDGLKYINDNFGHADGDSSIAAVAKALFNATPSNSLSTRFGGDEVFSVIIGECDPDEIIRNIDNYLDEYNKKVRKPYTVATSSGYITSVINDDFDFNAVLKAADEEMYKIKNQKYSARGGAPGHVN
jgi:diguanylate cyclase (GGDEF)-like protein